MYNWQVNFMQKDIFWENKQSLKFITDLGAKDECQKFDDTVYSHLALNITNLPIHIFLGICIPTTHCT